MNKPIKRLAFMVSSDELDFVNDSINLV
jgi:hypothetical protein